MSSDDLVEKSLRLGGHEYTRSWFVPRMAVALMADALTQHSDIEAWDVALARAERLADHIANHDPPDLLRACGCESRPDHPSTDRLGVRAIIHDPEKCPRCADGEDHE
jgi:hypothetical protein